MRLFLFFVAVIVFTWLALLYIDADYNDNLRNCQAEGYSEEMCVMLLR